MTKDNIGKINAEDRIIIDELDFEIEFRPNDEEFNETYKKFCIHIIDNDNKTGEILKQSILNNMIKASRYDNLQDRYLNQNQKHFDELCELYFEDKKLK